MQRCTAESTQRPPRILDGSFPKRPQPRLLNGLSRVPDSTQFCAVSRKYQNIAIFQPFLVFRRVKCCILEGLPARFRPSILHCQTGGLVTFEIGDKVIYPNHGLGIVQGIEDKTILGTTCGFYHLRIVANETVVLVPV